MLNADEINSAIERIRRMEQYFDIIGGEIQFGNYSIVFKPPFDKMYKSLVNYLDGGQWQKDFGLDEQGELPQWLKRGVLSEDGLYNLICDIENYCFSR